MKIVNMNQLNENQINQAAQILTDSLPKGWETFQDAMDEIEERLIPKNTLLVAIEYNEVLGWGGILAPSYDGNVFELHPLAVRQDKRNQGIGKQLVIALEDEARNQGGKTIHLGADDEDNETSFSSADLYDDLPSKINNFEAGTHQAGFYFKLGYKIIGVMPDANGMGKPDIYFGKRL